MIVLENFSVGDALRDGLEQLLVLGERASSRNGEVLVMPCPVTSVYNDPRSRVLLDCVRDANPFFHLAEMVWMLAGRDEASFLNHYIRDFGSRFAEDGVLVHGAYGHRWRSALGFDQLSHIANVLSTDPSSRQCVLQMWDSDVEGSDDLRGVWKDRPCNTHIYFRVRGTELDMTVCCRSNDIVWGAYGANAVHFSFLQEYMAGLLGLSIGKMYQISNNFHLYVSELERIAGRAGLTFHELWTNPSLVKSKLLLDNRKLSSFPWDSVSTADVQSLHGQMEHIHASTEPDKLSLAPLRSMFLTHVVRNAVVAHRFFRLGRISEALSTAAIIAADDWRVACYEWLARRAA